MTSDLSNSLNSFFKWIYSLAVIGFLFSLLLPDPSSAEPSVPLSQDNSKETLLLVWKQPFRTRAAMPDCWKQFAIGGCKVTDDKRLYSQADAVLIHHRDVTYGSGPLPQTQRPPGQKWIWFNYESPTHVSLLWKYEGIYNLTLSYREDSDVSLPYGFLIPVAHLDQVPQGRYAYPLGGGTSTSDLIRPHLVAWVVSNWRRHYARVAFYNLLKDHIKIDLFGGRGKRIPSGTAGVMDVLKQYRFYLAFENSQHTDYIAEKLWNAVQSGAIPVVLGPSRKNYERFLSAEAFIHVDDFPTAKDLAQYLLKVKDSPSLIEKHLSWRKNFSLIRPSVWSEHYCTACLAAKKYKGRIDLVKNLNDWFHS